MPGLVCGSSRAAGRTAVPPAHCDTDAGAAFRSRLVTARFETVDISRLDAGPQRILRRAVDIARVMKPRYYLCCHLDGHGLYRERGEEQLVGPGQMILLDNCEPYVAEYREPVSTLVLHLPQDLLRERLRQPERWVGRRLDGQAGLSRITADFLRGCLDQADALADAQRPALAGVALDLVTRALAGSQGEDRDHEAPSRALLWRLKQQIDSRLGDPGLDLDRLARACGTSTRQVSRLFQRDGDSFGRYLLRQRLERCRQALADPDRSGQRIGDLALDHGFNNLAHFSRVFREAFGCTPSEWRAVQRD